MKCFSRRCAFLFWELLTPPLHSCSYLLRPEGEKKSMRSRFVKTRTVADFWSSYLLIWILFPISLFSVSMPFSTFSLLPLASLSFFFLSGWFFSHKFMKEIYVFFLSYFNLKYVMQCQQCMLCTLWWAIVCFCNKISVKMRNLSSQWYKSRRLHSQLYWLPLRLHFPRPDGAPEVTYGASWNREVVDSFCSASQLSDVYLAWVYLR